MDTRTAEPVLKQRYPKRGGPVAQLPQKRTPLLAAIMGKK